MMADTIEKNYNHQLVDGILSSKNDSQILQLSGGSSLSRDLQQSNGSSNKDLMKESAQDDKKVKMMENRNNNYEDRPIHGNNNAKFNKMPSSLSNPSTQYQEVHTQGYAPQ